MQTLYLTLRERTVEFEFEPLAPEHDVGLMGWGYENWTIRDEETGEVLDWHLTAAEEQEVAQCVNDYMDRADQDD